MECRKFHLNVQKSLAKLMQGKKKSPQGNSKEALLDKKEER